MQRKKDEDADEEAAKEEDDEAPTKQQKSEDDHPYRMGKTERRQEQEAVSAELKIKVEESLLRQQQQYQDGMLCAAARKSR